MKTVRQLSFFKPWALILVVLLLGSAPLPGARGAEATATKAEGKQEPELKPIPKAVFVDDFKQGKDPFFPDSQRRNPAPPPVVKVPEKVEVVEVKPVILDPYEKFSLKGITGSQSRRFALIHTGVRGYSFAPGESLEVRIPATKEGSTEEERVRLKCLQIDADSVVVQIKGEEKTKKLDL